MRPAPVRQRKGDVVMPIMQSRRRFLTALSSAGAAGLMGVPNAFAEEAPPETTIIRLPKFSTAICGAPVYVADALLRAEGFSIRYVATQTGMTGAQLAARGEVDFDNAFTGSLVILIDTGEPITMLGGLHIGCYELF